MPHGLSVFDAEKISGMAKWLGDDLHMPAPLLLAYLAKGAEFFGGLLLALGLGTRVAAVFLIVTMAVAVLGAHADDMLVRATNALLYLLLFFSFLLMGPGPWSLDHWLRTGGNSRRLTPPAQHHQRHCHHDQGRTTEHRRSQPLAHKSPAQQHCYHGVHEGIRAHQRRVRPRSAATRRP